MPAIPCPPLTAPPLTAPPSPLPPPPGPHRVLPLPRPPPEDVRRPPRLQADHRQAVRHDVVHLAAQPQPLPHGRPVGPLPFGEPGLPAALTGVGRAAAPQLHG